MLPLPRERAGVRGSARSCSQCLKVFKMPPGSCLPAFFK